MATHIKLTALQRGILNRVLESTQGFERVEDIHAALNADDNDFVIALESLEGGGYLSVRNLGGAIVVGFDDPFAALSSGSRIDSMCTDEVGVC